MDTLYIAMAMIVATTGSIPVSQKTIEVTTSNDLAVLQGVNTPETIITPKPEEKPVTSVSKANPVKVKRSFYTSTEAELADIPSQGSCYDYVSEMSAKYGVEADLLSRIIRAESGGSPLAKNKNSTASGCGQFIRSTWAGTLRQMGVEWVTPFDARMNVEAMAFKISRGGIRAWDASRHAWDK